MTILTETRHDAAFILSEANGYRSRQSITLRNAGVSVITLLAGTVLGQITTGTLSAVATAFAGNTGNGVMGAVTVDLGAPTGTYRVVVTEPATNVGNFIVERPDGTIDGQGDVATAYNGSINFTMADGATDFAAGDGFDIVVTAAAATNQGNFVIHDPEGTNGSQVVAGILFGETTVPAASAIDATAVVRDAEVRTAYLVFDDHDAGEKTAAIAQLARLGIIARA